MNNNNTIDNKVYIIKIGGNIIDDDATLTAFLQQFATINAYTILIHGGGKLATRLAEQMGVQQQMIDGRRITDAETLKIVTMVYSGYINKNIVAKLQALQCNAIGLSGADGKSITSYKRGSKLNTASAVDYGFVGDIESINTTLLKNLLQLGLSPVFSAITADTNGQLLNTNADTIAQSIATALSKYFKTYLVYGFEKPGVLLDVNDDNSVIPIIYPAYYDTLKTPNKHTGAAAIFAGMLPKLDNAFVALQQGVEKVIIGNALALHDLLNGAKGTTLQLHE